MHTYRQNRAENVLEADASSFAKETKLALVKDGTRQPDVDLALDRSIHRGDWGQIRVSLCSARRDRLLEGAGKARHLQSSERRAISR